MEQVNTYDVEKCKFIRSEDKLQDVLEKMAADDVAYVVCLLMVRYGFDMSHILQIYKADVNFVDDTILIDGHIYPIPDNCSKAIERLYRRRSEESNPYLFCSKTGNGPVNRSGLCLKISNILSSLHIDGSSQIFKKTYVYMYLKKYGSIEGANISFQRNKNRLLNYLGISEEEYSSLSLNNSPDTLFLKTFEQMYTHALFLRDSDNDLYIRESESFLEECEHLIHKYYSSLM